MSIYHEIRRQLYPPQVGQRAGVFQFRLEGRANDLYTDEGLAMRIADPLWLLGRQWQFGEFLGEDNATPVSVDVKFHRRQLNQLGSPDGSYRQVDYGSFPLEYCVENVPERHLNLRQCVQAGQQLARFIRTYHPDRAATLIGDLRRQFPLEETQFSPLDAESRDFFFLVQPTAINGQTCYETLQSEATLGQDFPEANRRYGSWYVKTYGLDPEAGGQYFRPDRLSHDFTSVYAGTNEALVLRAPDYRSGELDWDSFASLGFSSLKLESAVAKEVKNLQLAPVSFSAMPDKRLFTFEDNLIDLGEMQMDTADLLRMMMANFSFLSSNDWFTIPFDMQLGELAWIEEIVVHDAFGIKTVIKNGPATGGRQIGPVLSDEPLEVWDVFKIRDKNVDRYVPQQHAFLLTPTAHRRQESDPQEEVLLLRDEYANTVWALEKKVSNQLGQVRDGFDQHREINGPFLPQTPPQTIVRDEATGNELARFQLASRVPFNWIPYLPVHLEGQEKEVELWRARMVDSLDNRTIVPLSRLVREDLPRLREESIPRGGLSVRLTRQRIRWTDGTTYTWLGRATVAGRGEGSSGLRFDHLVTQQSGTDE